MLEHLCAAKDELDRAKVAYMRGSITYADLRAAAAALLALRQAAEATRYGKVKTKITAQAISSLIR